jgi:hypothetical protein
MHTPFDRIRLHTSTTHGYVVLYTPETVAVAGSLPAQVQRPANIVGVIRQGPVLDMMEVSKQLF